MLNNTRNQTDSIIQNYAKMGMETERDRASETKIDYGAKLLLVGAK